MLFTSEQVSAGHPDKICDQISDAIVTDCLKHDRNSRVAVEAMIKDDHVYVAGEITSKHEPNISYLVRNVLLFTEPELYESFKLETQISKQSGDIALGVDKKGAGDQGMMFGYATNETRKMLPMPFVLATEAIEGLDIKRHPGLLHDAKAQVTYDYGHRRIDTFLISTQHKEDMEPDDVFHLCKRIMENVAEAHSLNKDFRVLVNPTGRFVTGGSFADTGVTGRKIMCDTYGGACRHGGGAFSGKDPTKVDRSGAYMARKIAKDILRHGFARRCEVQLAYAIGIEEPVSVYVNTFHIVNQMLLKHRAKLEASQTAMEEAQARMQAEQENAKATKAQVDELLSWAECFDKADIGTKHLIVSRLIERVEVRTGYKMHIKFKISLKQFLGQE